MNRFVFLLFLSLSNYLNSVASEMHIKAAAAANNQAKAAAAVHRFATAIEFFQKAIEIEPTFEEAYEGLIGAYLSSGHFLDAAAAITKFLETEPNAVRYRVTLGQILLELKQPERALAQFSFVLKTDPFHPEALLGFATAASQFGLPDRAAEALERGKAHYPADSRFKNVSQLNKPN